MIPDALQPVANHLWQSTFFAAAAWLMTLTLRTNHARTRYWLWFAASVKFLVPVSILIGIGGALGPHTAPAIVGPGISSAMMRVSQPFAAPLLVLTAPVPLHSPRTSPIPLLLLAVWALGFVTIASSWWLRWRSLHAALRTATRFPLPIGIEAMTSPVGIDAMTSPAFAEPGVYGIRRPILLLPAGIAGHLTPPQLQSILAHELCHVRRRDNLTAAIQMAVEALFWFYPLVWWLGARLMDERERACDEDVLLATQPELYAESILRICELYMQSPLSCVAGVTGANLKKRIEAIMSNRTLFHLSFAKKAALIAAGTAALAVPVIVGVINAPALLAQSPLAFEAASIKPVPDSIDWPPRAGYWVPPTDDPQRFWTRIQVSRIIEFAYGLRDFQIVGGPAWIKDGNFRFDIQATAPRPSTRDEMRQMVQTLLADRFKLKLHRETRELPVYALIAGKDGPKLATAEDGSENGGLGEFNVGNGMFWGRGATMPLFVEILTDNMDRPVIDKTNLTGHYDFTLHYDQSSLPDWRLGPALPSMMRDLGLKLEPQKASFEMLVIDSIDRPSEN